MATKQISKKNIKDFENDDPITIRPSQLRLLIQETIEESLEKIRMNEMNKESKGKSSNGNLPRDKLESMSAAQVKKLANQKAADEKVTIRVTGKSKIPTKQDNINFLLQETPSEEEHDSSPEKTDKKKDKKKEAVYDSQRRVYVIGKDAANEKGEVYGRLLKSGKVRPFTSEEITDLLKKKTPSVFKLAVTQNDVNKYRKVCEKKDVSKESSESEESSESSEISESSDSSTDSNPIVSSDED